MTKQNVLLAVGLLIAALTAAPALAAKAISSCHTTITSGGRYLVSGNLSTASGNCINIKASGVILDLGTNTLTGPGSAGTAVRIFSNATGAMVFNGIITGWHIGVEVDSSKAVVDNISMTGGVVDIGVLLSGASAAVISAVDAASARTIGAKLVSSSNCVVESLGASGSGTFGILVKGSSGNQLIADDTSLSGNIGTYITCLGATCSSGNLVLGTDGSLATNYGIKIDSGNTKNRVVGSDGSLAGTDDLFDGNSHCDSNVWAGNLFSTSNRTCIH